MMMMNNEKVIKGYILRSVPYGENDAIVSCLTENGIISFKARGILKPTSKNASSCLLYAFSELILEEKNNNFYLTKGKIIKSNYKLYDSIDYMCCVGLLAESILNFLGDDTNIKSYLMFDKVLEGLNQGFDIFTLTSIGLAKIINETGYGIEVNSCIRCGEKTKIVSLNYLDGGFICSRCLNRDDKMEETNYLKSIRYIFNVDLDNYFHHTIEKNLNIRIIKELMRYLQAQFDYRKISFFELFNQTY